MGKQLNNEEKEFVRKVAKESSSMIIKVDEIRKAFKILTDKDIATMPAMRQELYKINKNPNLMEDSKELEMPEFLKKRIEAEKVQEIVSKATTFSEKVLEEMLSLSDDMSDENELIELQERYNQQHDKMEEETKIVLEMKGLHHRSRRYLELQDQLAKLK